MKKTRRIVIVDNNPACSADFREALESQPDFTIAAAVTCASCSFAAVTQQKPDLVLLTLSMPDHRLLELVKDLTVLHAGLKVLIVSSNHAELETESVQRAGAQGCLLTSCSTATKLNAVRQVLANRQDFIPPLVGAQQR